MILDTSALIAILKEEPEAEALKAALLAAPEILFSAATYLEACIVVDRYKNPILRSRMEEILSETKTKIMPFTFEQASLARQAYRDYGRGSGHPANLNFGDCFSYALARDKQQPLLYKGEDFRHTDLRPAV